MKKLLLTLGTLAAIAAPLATVIACSGELTNEELKELGYRARCGNGTLSMSTGSGTCSHNGGVAYWLSKVYDIETISNIELTQIYGGNNV